MHYCKREMENENVLLPKISSSKDKCINSFSVIALLCMKK